MTTALKLAARGVLMACGALGMVVALYGAPDQAGAIVGTLSALLIASAAS